MKATLMPLKGKYYGTKVEIETDDDVYYLLNLWNSNSGIPSERELAQWDEFEVCDGHFESKETYELANLIVSLLNASKSPQNA